MDKRTTGHSIARRISFAACLYCVTLAFSGAAMSELIDRGGGLIYDTEQNVTWLQDANYAKTNLVTFNGKMNWPQAMSLVANLDYYDSVRDKTWSDWRLPNARHSAVADPCFDLNCSESELGFLHYAEGIREDAQGPFENFRPLSYWSETGRAPLIGAWLFHFGLGKQDFTGAFEDLLVAFVWPVRDGDVIDNAPVAVDDIISVNEGASITVIPGLNDTDADNDLDISSVVIQSGPANGQIGAVGANGDLEYTHDGSETLADSFTYTIDDLRGATSNAATATITINPQNDTPQFDSAPITTASESQAYDYDVVVSDRDAADILTVSVVGALPAWLTLTQTSNITANLTGTANGTAVGNNAVTLRVGDGSLFADQTFSIAVDAAPDGPILTLNGDDRITITQGEAFSDPGAVASDAQDGDLTDRIVVDSAVNTDAAGTHLITYTVTDTAGQSASIQRTVEVVAVARQSSDGGSSAISPLMVLALGLIAIVYRSRSARNRERRAQRTNFSRIPRPTGSTAPPPVAAAVPVSVPGAGVRSGVRTTTVIAD